MKGDLLGRGEFVEVLRCRLGRNFFLDAFHLLPWQETEARISHRHVGQPRLRCFRIHGWKRGKRCSEWLLLSVERARLVEMERGAADRE